MIVGTLLLAGATLVLPQEAKVRGTEIALDAIAEIRCTDHALRARLSKHPLGWAPAPGYTRTIARWQLARELGRAFPEVEFAWDGAESTRVLPEVEHIPGASLVAVAEAALRADLAGQDSEVRLVEAPHDQDVPLARTRSELRAGRARSELAAGVRSVPVEVWIDGSLHRTVWTSFEIGLWSEQPVLLRAVRRGEPIDAGAFVVRRARVGAGGPAGIGPDALVGANARRDLPAGTTPTEQDVERARLVRPGDAIQLEVRKGAVVARAPAIAREGGSLGDRVRVTSSSGQREVVARVAGRGLVVVELAPAGAPGGLR